ncbi:hypothetical protein ACJ41O_011626 [Fusarium nematophilum]
MNSLPLRDLTGRGPEGYPRLENHDNAYGVSDHVQSGSNNSQDDVTPPPKRALGSAVPADNAEPIFPITEEEACRVAHLPELNFRPTALKTWYLVVLMIWHLLCMGGVATLVALGKTQPPWFRFGSRSSFWIRTGLKWNPAPLASQLSLLQGSDMFDVFEGIDYSKLMPLKDAVKWWPEDGLILRLGYWRQQGTNNIVHGVRFLDRNGQLGTTRWQAGSSPGGNPASREVDPQPDVDRLWNLYQFDWFIILTIMMGVAALTAASVAWAKRLIFQPFTLPPMISGSVERGIIFSLLPQVLFGLFHHTSSPGVILAALSNSVYLVVARIFDFNQVGDNEYTVHAHPNSFYASFAIMVVYCLSNWILRPHGLVRTCRPVHSLVDFASLVYRSDILLCPEFWLQDPSDTKEHMKAQVTMANRLYRFGVYKGMDRQEHIGIGVYDAPPARPSDKDDILCLGRSVGLARAAFTSGVYNDASLGIAENFMQNIPPKRPSLDRVCTNPHRSWRRRAKRMACLGS